MLVRSWMTRDVMTISPDSSLQEAADLIVQGRRRLPVVDEENRLVGIITTEDVKKALPSSLGSGLDKSGQDLTGAVTVQSFMSPSPMTVAPGDTLERVATMMYGKKVGGIPVVDNDVLVGIITESDLLQAFLDVLGSEEPGKTIELDLSGGSSTFYRAMELFADYDMEIVSVALCSSITTSHRQLSVRFIGEDVDALVDALWKNRIQVVSLHD